MSHTERLTVEINADLKEKFKAKLKSEGRTMTYVIEKFVKEYTDGKSDQ